MIQIEYFYRELFSENFLHTENPKVVIPVRPKNEFNSGNLYYSEEKKEWCSVPDNTSDNVFSEEKLGGYPVEFVETPLEPWALSITDRDFVVKDFQSGSFITPELEDFSPSQMKKFIEYRWQKKLYKFNEKNFKDKKKIEKDYHSAKITTDTENLTLTIKFYKFVREKNKNTEVPQTEEMTLFFDMKNGRTDVLQDYYDHNSLKNKNGTWYNINRYSFKQKKALKDKKLTDAELNTEIESQCEYLEEVELPVCVFEKAFEKILELAELFTGVSFEEKRNLAKTKTDFKYLLEIYKITMLPFEPSLYDIIMDTEIQSRPVIFNYKRNDSKVFKRFCRKYKIRNTKILRKCFMERPFVLITFLRLKDSGFKDMNLYNRILTDSDKCSIIDNCDDRSLAFFCRWSIKKRGQKNTMNTLLKTNDSHNIRDGLIMFCKYFKHIPDSLKEDILKDGFTEFNHDALANISWQYEHKNITFEYTDEQKHLEDEIDGYKFCLPENSYQLCEIGTAMHNCVASYSDKVKEKQCTIVYAEKDDKYIFCIEVQENRIVQERLDHNATPQKEEQKILDKWHERHSLVTK